MKTRFHAVTLASAALLASAGAAAEDNVIKFGVSEYTTHSRTNGISGVGVPAGADAKTGNATTVILVYERMLTPNIGAEFVIGVPPKIKAKATGTVAFLGDDVLSARSVSPTLFINYHFGAPGDTWRPYLGGGLNYTRFVRIESKLAPDVKMSDSTGWAAQAGIDYMLNREWSLFASVAALKVKSKLVASGSTVLQTTIDFRPIVYSIGTVYRF
jgi:outer membrane protein